MRRAAGCGTATTFPRTRASTTRDCGADALRGALSSQLASTSVAVSSSTSPNSDSTLLPSSRARRMAIATPGWYAPDSIAPSACREIPARRASAVCVRSRAIRARATALSLDAIIVGKSPLTWQIVAATRIPKSRSLELRHALSDAGAISRPNSATARIERSAESQPLHLSVGTPSPNDLVELDWAAAVQLARESEAFGRHAFVIVVAGGAGLEKFLIVHRLRFDRRDPFGFRLRRRLDASRFIRLGVLDELGDVLGLLLEHVWKVRGQGILRDSHVEAVREANAAEAVQRFQAAGPVLGQRFAAAAEDLEARAPRIGRAHFESGREDDAVRLVLDAVEHQPFFCELIDAAAHRVDQRDVRPVERRQIVVIESRALAELAVPWLQRVGGPLVLDELVDARANLVHLFEVGNFRKASDLFHRQRGVLVSSQEQAAEVADDVGPSVADQVDIRGQARHESVEIFHAMLLPARLQRLHPLGVSRPVAANVDRRRRALEHVQMLRVPAQVRHALHGSRAGADNGDALVGELVQISVGIAARVAVVPAAGVESVALVTLDAGNAG